jgi:tetratricopeptide (TPR) repeat protein
MGTGEIIASIIGTLLAIFGAYVGIRQIIQWRKDAKTSGELKDRLDDLSKKFDLYIDGLPEMAEKKRRASLSSGLESMQDCKYDEAIGFFRECLASSTKQSEKVALLILIGNCFLSTSRLKEAEEQYREAETAARESADKEGLSTSLGNIGIVYQIKGDLDKALENYQQALKIHREIGDRYGEANSLGNLGNVYQIKGELNKALENYKQALKIDGEIGHREGEAKSLNNMGIVYGIKGELDKALEHHQQALKIHHEIGYRMGEANALGNIGNVYQIKGELNKALENYKQALKIFEEIGATQEVAMTREAINLVRREQSQAR